MNKQEFYGGDNVVEVVKPLEDRRARVVYLYFKDKNMAKLWLTSNVEQRDDLVSRKRDMMIHLPDTRFGVRRIKNSFAVGSEQIKVKGITTALAQIFGDMFRVGPKFGMHTSPRLGKKCMQRLGTTVDGELKRFADGTIPFSSLRKEETKCIVQHLAQRNISLVSSGVLVSNYDKDCPHMKFSGTEIDLIGYDHIQRKFAIIEIKMTGKTLVYLKEKNKAAPLEKRCGFRRSEMGRYAAQLACSTLMFTNTYDSTPHYPLLVICEAGSKNCESFEIEQSLLSQWRFQMIDGFLRHGSDITKSTI